MSTQPPIKRKYGRYLSKSLEGGMPVLIPASMTINTPITNKPIDGMEMRFILLTKYDKNLSKIAVSITENRIEGRNQESAVFHRALADYIARLFFTYVK